MKKFWNWVKNEASETRTLYLDGAIAEETWLGMRFRPSSLSRS